MENIFHIVKNTYSTQACIITGPPLKTAISVQYDSKIHVTWVLPFTRKTPTIQIGQENSRGARSLAQSRLHFMSNKKSLLNQFPFCTRNFIPLLEPQNPIHTDLTFLEEILGGNLNVRYGSRINSLCKRMMGLYKSNLNS